MNKLKGPKYLAPFFFTLLGLFLLPSSIKHVRHIQITKILAIQTTKLEPPRVAFDLISMKAPEDSESKAASFANLNDWVEMNTWQPRSEYKNRRVQLDTMVFSKEEILNPAEASEIYSSLSSQQRQRLQMAQAENEVLSQDWRPPSFKDLAQQKIEEVSKNIESSARPSRVIVKAQSSDGQWKGPESIHTQGVAVRKNSGHSASGSVVTTGIALGNQQISVSHAYRNGKVSVAKFDRKTGQFETSLTDLSGAIVAELIDEDGHVVASGKQKISENMTPDQLANLKIRLDSLNEISGTTYNFSKLSDRLIAENIRSNQSVKADLLVTAVDQKINTDEVGGFRFKGVTPGSVSFVRTQSPGFYPGLHIASSSKKNKLPEFPSKLVEAILNISKDRQLYSVGPENKSVVWGQVLLDGKPLAGVKVEVLMNEDYQPIYLNGWLPDPNLDSTSENGYFIITNLPPGLHSLIAKRGEQQFSHANVQVDEESISPVVLEHTLKSDLAEVRAYNAFDGSALFTHLELQSLPEGISVEGFTEVRLPVIDRYSILTSQASQADYIPAQMFYSDTDNEINIPHIRQSWVSAIQASQKISSPTNAGLIVGFVKEEGFEAYLPHEENFARENIVYFDSSGQVVSHGVAGGGFLIFNVPLGSQAVTIMYDGSEQVHSQVVPVDAGYVSTLIFHF